MEMWALSCLLGPEELCMAWLGLCLGAWGSALSMSLPFLLAMLAAWDLSGDFPVGLHSPSDSLSEAFLTNGNGSETSQP